MSFRHQAVAYLVGWEHPGGAVDYKGRVYSDAGIYSSHPVTQLLTNTAKQRVLLSMGAHDYATAYELLVREINRRHDLRWALDMKTLASQVRTMAVTHVSARTTVRVEWDKP